MEARLWAGAVSPAIALRDDIVVTVERLSATTLRFCYVVNGPIDQILIPPPSPPLRANNLWRTTCFEAFLAPEDSTAYLELNFSPSSQWAAYDFEAYRAGMVQALLPAPPEIEVDRQPERLTVTAIVSLHLRDVSYRLGLAAVIEEQSGRKSYWMVDHTRDKPDFHHRDCFAFELPPAKQA